MLVAPNLVLVTMFDELLSSKKYTTEDVLHAFAAVIAHMSDMTDDDETCEMFREQARQLNNLRAKWENQI